MLKNYFRIALRSYGKNYLYTLINIIGMAVGLSGIIITLLLFNYEREFDLQHSNASNLYRVNSHRAIEGATQRWGVVPSTLGPVAKDAMPEISSFTRYGYSRSFLVQYEDIVHRESIAFADANFFDQFSFAVNQGQLKTFQDKSTAIISAEFATKYFGDEQAVGKVLTIRQNGEIMKQFQVGAVVEKSPLNSSFHFGIIAQYENLLDLFELEEFDWSIDIRPVLYVGLDAETTSTKVEEQLRQYVSVNNEIVDTWEIEDFYLVPFKEQKDEARFVHSYTTRSGLPISALYGSVVMNVLILFIACFNFANTSLAYANKRLKEIGIRRTFGGIRWQIIKQYFTENLILCFLSLVLSIEIANTWIGWMNKQWPIQIDTFYFNNWQITLNMLLLLVLVSLVAGAYPALYISKFHPTEILKGKLKLVGTNNFTRFLLTWQFAFSIMALFSGIVLTQNAQFQRTLDWGFDKQNVLIIPLQGEGNYDILRNGLLTNESISSIAGSVHNLGYGSVERKIDIDGIPHTAELFMVGDNYLETIGCTMLEGRHFLQDSESDQAESIIVNEDFVRTYDLQDPLSQTITMDGSQYNIIGVLKDFMPYGLFSPIKPTMVKAVPEDQFQHLSIRAHEEELPEILAEVNTSWKEIFPNKPFEGFFMEQVAFESMNINRGILVQFGIMGLFALFLSVTGLYSIVSLTVNKRVKEIGIRKVMGASVPNVMGLINREFAIILVIGVLIGSIGGYFFMDRFLSDIFTYYTKPGAMSIAIASLIVLTLTGITSGAKIYKFALKNPSDSLRYE